MKYKLILKNIKKPNAYNLTTNSFHELVSINNTLQKKILTD